jgi:hypothetical protein
MVTPSTLSAAAMSSVSRDRRGRRSRLVPSEIAARTNALLVADFEPGIVTVASTG